MIYWNQNESRSEIVSPSRQCWNVLDSIYSDTILKSIAPEPDKNIFNGRFTILALPGIEKVQSV